jgi:hypothetical protein
MAATQQGMSLPRAAAQCQQMPPQLLLIRRRWQKQACLHRALQLAQLMAVQGVVRLPAARQQLLRHPAAVLGHQQAQLPPLMHRWHRWQSTWRQGRQRQPSRAQTHRPRSRCLAPSVLAGRCVVPCHCNVVPPYDSTTVQFTLIHEEAFRAGALSVLQDIFRMNQKQLEGAVRRMWGDKNLEPARKSYLMQHIMASRYIVAQQQHKLGVGSESADTAQQSGAFHCTHTDRWAVAGAVRGMRADLCIAISTCCFGQPFRHVSLTVPACFSIHACQDACQVLLGLMHHP